MSSQPSGEFDHLSEGEFQSSILDLVRALGLQAYHTHDSRRSQKGFPDLVIVGSNGVLYRELKTMTGVVTEEQKYWLSILQAAGADVAIWRPNLWPEPITRDLRALGSITVPKPPYRRARLIQRARR